ncbi:Transcriptional regulator%2C MerR family [Mycobacteroides abscessus]|nr:Transcriptional regulator%2C MerR family [Mycobacteroides abscessus]
MSWKTCPPMRTNVARALLDLFNPAQLDVLIRVGAAVRSEPGEG